MIKKWSYLFVFEETAWCKELSFSYDLDDSRDDPLDYL